MRMQSRHFFWCVLCGHGVCLLVYERLVHAMRACMSYGENSDGKFSAIKVFDEMSLKDVVTWNQGSKYR